MSATPNKAELRAALTEQVAYLLDEIDALRAVVHRVAEPVLSGRPLPSDPSIKEMYGRIAEADAYTFLPFLETLAAGETPDVPAHETSEREPGWNERSISDLLDDVSTHRTRLVEHLRTLPAQAWEQTGRIGGQVFDVYALTHHITQHDTEWLRAAAYRLHESHLTARDQDLPK